MILYPNNYNAISIGQTQQLNIATGQWGFQNSITWSVTFYDPNGNPLAGLTALSVPNVAGSNGNFLQQLIVGNLTPASNYQMVLVSTGSWAAYVTVANQNVMVATRTG